MVGISLTMQAEDLDGEGVKGVWLGQVQECIYRWKGGVGRLACSASTLIFQLFTLINDFYG